MSFSFDAINYATRPNKTVERKMLVETLAHLGSAFPMRDYRYLGFGSMWFSDFILAHHVLEIRDMISIESAESRKDRAEFNRPFGCVKVEMGSASRVLPRIDWTKRVVCWLDYDGPISEAVVGDVSLVGSYSPAGSVVVVSVNADVRTIEEKDGGSAAARAARLRDIAGDAVPVGTDSVDRLNYPDVLAKTLENVLVHSVRNSGRSLSYEPLFNFKYSDGAPMVTVGGILLDDSLRESYVRPPFPYLTPGRQFEIAVPHLTIREKLAFDRLLPSSHPPTVKALQFTIPSQAIEAYWLFYRYYPLFSELKT